MLSRGLARPVWARVAGTARGAPLRGVSRVATRSGRWQSQGPLSLTAAMAAAVCCRHSKIPLRAHSTASQGMGKAPAAATLERAGLEVELVSCLGDNYCPVVHHAASQVTIVMDTPEAGPIASAIRRRGWTLTHILNTHYHGDHVGGNLELKAQFPGVQIVGHRSQEFKYPGPYPPPGVEHEVIPGIDLEVREGDEVLCGGLNARVLEVGGHTAAHIAYFFHEVPMAFAGDALFPMGCGRVFTGDFVRMQASLQKLRDLPDETVVFCSHEYTKANVDFAVKVEPGNAALLARQAEVQKLRSADEPTVPTILGNEKATNPFLRWDAPEVQQAVGMTEAAAVFTAVRKWKDTGHRPQAKL